MIIHLSLYLWSTTCTTNNINIQDDFNTNNLRLSALQIVNNKSPELAKLTKHIIKSQTFKKPEQAPTPTPIKMTCDCCYDDWVSTYVVQSSIDCQHNFCVGCLVQAVRTSFDDPSQFEGGGLTCQRTRKTRAKRLLQAEEQKKEQAEASKTSQVSTKKKDEKKSAKTKQNSKTSTAATCK